MIVMITFWTCNFSVAIYRPYKQQLYIIENIVIIHITMLADTSFFQFQGGIRSTLFDMLQLNEANENDSQPIIHSPFMIWTC